MSGNFLLDWATLAVSLFNTILVFWLGLTVLLNAERRTWGVWFTGGGLLLGGLFFVSHSAILGLAPVLGGYGINFWWHVGWPLVVALPFSWYVVILWYSGFWDDAQTALRLRHGPVLVFLLVATAGLIGLLVFANPLPSLVQVAQFNFSTTLTVRGVPLLLIIYPVYIVACIGLSLDVLLRPAPSRRVMGEQARRRARPWLMGAAAVFLLVTLLVSWALEWIVSSASSRTFPDFYVRAAFRLAVFDGVIASLIAAAVILVGQAVVVYEVFTGKSLPRHGLRREWRRAILLAAGYSVVVSWSLTVGLRPIYSLLLTAVLMTAFFALAAWRSYVEREYYMRSLRPFVASQHFYPAILEHALPEPAASPLADAAAPFYALCDEVLGTERACLAALGALGPLVDPPLTYPPARPPPPFPPAAVFRPLDSPTRDAVPLEAPRFEGFIWAVPLWSERGLIGVLLLGEKRDGGLYSQEEIEIARASGERLIDSCASAELARRLVALQRQRLAESQVLDRRARRILHDDVLPHLHTAILTLNTLAAPGEAAAGLAEAHHQISELLRDLPTTVTPEVVRRGLLGALRQALDDEWAGAFDQVDWQIDAEAERRAGAIPPLTAEVLFYAAREAIRNAAKYGRGADPAARLCLRVSADWADGLRLAIEDNGGRWDAKRATPEAGGGSGQGLALHSTLLAVIGGTLAVESVPGAYTRLVFTLPPNAV